MLERPLATLIVKFRKERGYTQERLAELAELHVNYISFLERCQRKPTLEAVYKICKALDMSLTDFIIKLEEELTREAKFNES